MLKMPTWWCESNLAFKASRVCMACIYMLHHILWVLCTNVIVILVVIWLKVAECFLPVWCGDFGFQCHCRRVHNLPIHSNRPSHNRWGRALRCSPRAGLEGLHVSNVLQLQALVQSCVSSNSSTHSLQFLQIIAERLQQSSNSANWLMSFQPVPICSAPTANLQCTRSVLYLVRASFAYFAAANLDLLIGARASLPRSNSNRLWHLRGKSFRIFTVRLRVIAEVSVAQHGGAKATSIIETLVRWHDMPLMFLWNDLKRWYSS